MNIDFTAMVMRCLLSRECSAVVLINGKYDLKYHRIRTKGSG